MGHKCGVGRCVFDNCEAEPLTITQNLIGCQLRMQSSSWQLSSFLLAIAEAEQQLAITHFLIDNCGSTQQLTILSSLLVGASAFDARSAEGESGFDNVDPVGDGTKKQL